MKETIQIYDVTQLLTVTEESQSKKFPQHKERDNTRDCHD